MRWAGGKRPRKGDREAENTEYKEFVEALFERAPFVSDVGYRLVDAGLHDTFVSAGLDIPADLQDVPRTIYSDPEKPHLDKFYDQIAWFTGRNELPALSLRYSRGGFFDFTQSALTSRGLTKTQLSWRISDYFPLWAEFSTRD